MARTRTAARTLVEQIIVHEPDTMAPHTFEAGTTEDDLPDWARAEIRNPHVWSDAPWRDERIEGVLVPRLLAYGAAMAMVDELVAAIEAEPEDAREAAVTQALAGTNDDGAVRAAIGTWRTGREAHGGETYAVYVERARDAGTVPAAFDAWLAVADAGPLPVAQAADPAADRQTAAQMGSGPVEPES
jgi:hypothetical protein